MSTTDTDEVQISEPLQAMSLETMFDAADTVSPEVFLRLYLPEIRKKIAELQAQPVDEARTALNELHEDMHILGQQAGTIANTYANAVEFAAITREQEAQNPPAQVADLEERIRGAQSERDEIQFQLETVQYTTRALMHMVRPAIVFSLQVPDQFSTVESRALRQVLRDYPEDDGVRPSLCVPQQSYFKAMKDLENAQKSITGLNEVAKEQSSFIAEQADKLTNNLTIIQRNIKMIQTKDHEIRLLGQQLDKLNDKVARYEQQLRTSEKDRENSEKLIEEYASMTKKNEEQIQAKEHALFELRKEYQNLEEKLTMSQAKITELQEAGSGVVPQRQVARLNNSVSTFTLGVQNLTRGAVPSGRPQQTYRMVPGPANPAIPRQAEIASIQSSELSRSVPSSIMARPIYNRRLSDPFRLAPAFDTPPRESDVPEMPRLPIGMAQDRNKPLPSPPTVSPRIPSDAVLGRPQVESCGEHGQNGQAGSISGSTSEQGSKVFSTPVPDRRVLSRITEASREFSDSAQSASATSSDKEAIRSSINAFNALNGQTSPVVDMSPSQDVMLVKKRRALRKVASEELGVAQLYHHGRRRQM